MAGDTDVSLGVRWHETGADVPARAREHLRGLGAAAHEAAPAVGDRMATAFARLEAREPTMVLRRARLAIEELGASAVGVQGPLGRMAVSLAMLIPGGTLTLGAVAGFAAIGFEIKKIIEFSTELDKKLLKLGESLAVGPSKVVFHVADLRHQVEELQSPGLFATISNTIADMFTPTGWSAQTSGAAIGRRTQQAALQTAADIAQQDVTDERIRREQEYAKTLETSGLAVMKAELGLHPTNAQLETLARWTDAVRIGALKLSAADMAAMELNERKIRRLERETALLKEQEAIVTKAGVALPGFGVQGKAREDELAAAAIIAKMPGWGPAVVERFRRLEGEGATLARGPGGIGIMGFTGGVGGPAAGVTFTGPGGTAAQTGITGPGGMAAVTGIEGITALGRQQLDARNLTEANKDATLGMRVLERSITGLTSVIIGANRGGVSGGIQAVGGVLTTLSALGKVGAAGLEGALPALGPVGTVISAVGALTSLFHGSGPKPKVIITAFEEQAREQIQQIRGDPATTSFVILGPDGQATAYSLARLASRGVIPRFPGSR